jgi:hypothetical protein
LRSGSADAVRKILRDGPPFNLEDTSLERHRVFLSGDELVFVFEGPHADQEAARLLAQPAVRGRASRIGDHLVGAPRVSEEIFSWSRPDDLPGVDFGPLPGPGDSEGGSAGEGG